MSDSDDTIPARDEVNARLYETEASCITGKDELQTSISEPRRSTRQRSPRSFAHFHLDYESDSNDTPVIDARANKQILGRASRRHMHKRQQEAESDESENTEQEEDELAALRHPKLLTARQLSLQQQRAMRSNQQPYEASDETQTTEASGSLVGQTPEEVAAHQRSIAKRREKAKHKAEKEKQQTVERLLKVNVHSVGMRKGCRGRGSKNSLFTLPQSSSCTALNSQNPPVHPSPNENMCSTDEMEVSVAASSGKVSPLSAGSHAIQPLEVPQRTHVLTNASFVNSTSDPQPGWVRFISSERLTPSNVICIAPDSPDDAVILPTYSNPPPFTPLRLCEMGCGRQRRYACSKTGRSLCSLQCYTTNKLSTSRTEAVTPI